MQQETISWSEEVNKRKDELIHLTRRFLQIPSVLDESTAGPGAPFGEGIRQALEFALKVCQDAGMTVKNVDGYAGHAEFGEGDEIVGILSHVDVVPEGDGWTSPPFAAEIVDNRIVARGALDDKGPAMAAIMAARIVKELGLPLKRRVRLIFGTDEETLWRCVKYYFQREEMPAMGFTPDADFPIIYAEKGLTHLVWRQTPADFARLGLPEETAPEAELLQFRAGLRMNMVPERARAVLQAAEASAEELAERYRRYLTESGRTGDVAVEGKRVVLTMDGVSVHGSEPAKGVNAGTELVRFLSGLKLNGRAALFARFVHRFLHRQHGGEALGIAHDDPEMGPLTLNTGVIEYDADGDAVFHVNIRYPHSHPFDRWQPQVQKHLAEAGFSQEIVDHMVPHRVPPEHPLVAVLKRVYEEQTGEPGTPLAIGGATYGRSLDIGVAFGPLFPGRPDCAHQRDEHIQIDDLLRATALYAQAIYELANA